MFLCHIFTDMNKSFLQARDKLSGLKETGKPFTFSFLKRYSMIEIPKGEISLGRL